METPRQWSNHWMVDVNQLVGDDNHQFQRENHVMGEPGSDLNIECEVVFVSLCVLAYLTYYAFCSCNCISPTRAEIVGHEMLVRSPHIGCFSGGAGKSSEMSSGAIGVSSFFGNVLNPKPFCVCEHSKTRLSRNSQGPQWSYGHFEGWRGGVEANAPFQGPVSEFPASLVDQALEEPTKIQLQKKLCWDEPTVDGTICYKIHAFLWRPFVFDLRIPRITVPWSASNSCRSSTSSHSQRESSWSLASQHCHIRRSLVLSIPSGRLTIQ